VRHWFAHLPIEAPSIEARWATANARKDGICACGISNGFVPMLNRQLACDDGGGAAVAVFEGFHQIPALRGRQDGKATVVDDQHILAGAGLAPALRAAIPAVLSKGLEHARGTLTEDGPCVSAILVPHNAKRSSFCQGRSGQAFSSMWRIACQGNGSAGSHLARSNRRPQDWPSHCGQCHAVCAGPDHQLETPAAKDLGKSCIICPQLP